METGRCWTALAIQKLLTTEVWEACLGAFTEQAGRAEEIQTQIEYVRKLYTEFNKLSVNNYEFTHTFNMACEVILATELDPRYSFDMGKFLDDEKELFPETYLIERD